MRLKLRRRSGGSNADPSGRRDLLDCRSLRCSLAWSGNPGLLRRSKPTERASAKSATAPTSAPSSATHDRRRAGPAADGLAHRAPELGPLGARFRTPTAATRRRAPPRRRRRCSCRARRPRSCCHYDLLPLCRSPLASHPEVTGRWVGTPVELEGTFSREPLSCELAQALDIVRVELLQPAPQILIEGRRLERARHHTLRRPPHEHAASTLTPIVRSWSRRAPPRRSPPR